MPLVTWQPSYSVNVGVLDRQHRKLIDLINQLHAAMAGGQGRTVLGDVLAGLAEYARIHFDSEENYMREYGYPDYARHRAQHQFFVDKLDLFRQNFVSGKFTVTQDVLSFLSDWLINHIKGSDKAYSHLFNEKGLR